MRVQAYYIFCFLRYIKSRLAVIYGSTYIIKYSLTIYFYERMNEQINSTEQTWVNFMYATNIIVYIN